MTANNPYSWPIIALSLAVANMTFGFGIFFPYLPLFAESLGASLGLQIGLLTTGFMISRTIRLIRMKQKIYITYILSN